MNSLRKVRMTFPFNDPMVVLLNPKISKAINPLFIFSLEEFELLRGNVKWLMKTPENALTEGGVGEVKLTTLKGYGDLTISLSIPVTFNKRGLAVCPEFIVILPQNLSIYPLRTLKNKYGVNDLLSKWSK